MVRFTIRELKSNLKSNIFNAAQKNSIRRYLKSKEAQERIARGKRMARKRRMNNYGTPQLFGIKANWP